MENHPSIHIYTYIIIYKIMRFVYVFIWFIWILHGFNMVYNSYNWLLTSIILMTFTLKLPCAGDLPLPRFITRGRFHQKRGKLFPAGNSADLAIATFGGWILSAKGGSRNKNEAPGQSNPAVAMFYHQDNQTIQLTDQMQPWSDKEWNKISWLMTQRMYDKIWKQF